MLSESVSWELVLDAITREALERGWISETQIPELHEAVEFQMMEIVEEKDYIEK